MAAPRRLAIDRDEVGSIRPHLPHPRRKAGGEQPGIDPVHQQGQPAAAGNAVVIRQDLAQKRQMRLTPGGDVFVIVAVGDRPAHHQKQNLRQGVSHPPGLARVIDPREMLQQRPKAGFLSRG
jgi:hypothetical protein